jgi:hypothetical protein
MEVDCLEIVNFWDSHVGSRAVVAPILQEIEGSSSSFVSFIIQHVSTTYLTVKVVWHMWCRGLLATFHYRLHNGTLRMGFGR